MTTPTRNFGFDDDTVYMYSHGYCWWLAKALSDLTDLPVIAVWGKGCIRHVGVELPNGDVVDIDGVWNLQNWRNFWKSELDYCEEFSVGSVSMDDSGWRNVQNTYTPAMLSKNFELDYTLGEICDTIISILNRYHLLRPLAA